MQTKLWVTDLKKVANKRYLKENFLSNNILVQKDFGSKIVCNPKTNWGPKQFGLKKKLGPNWSQFFVWSIFLSKIILGTNIFRSKKFKGSKKVGSKKIVCQKKIC